MAAKRSSKREPSASDKQEVRRARYETRRKKNNVLISFVYGIVAAVMAIFVLLNTANGNFGPYGYFVGLVFLVFGVGLLMPDSLKSRFLNARENRRKK